MPIQILFLSAIVFCLSIISSQAIEFILWNSCLTFTWTFYIIYLLTCGSLVTTGQWRCWWRSDSNHISRLWININGTLYPSTCVGCIFDRRKTEKPIPWVSGSQDFYSNSVSGETSIHNIFRYSPKLASPSSAHPHSTLAKIRKLNTHPNPITFLLGRPHCTTHRHQHNN